MKYRINKFGQNEINRRIKYNVVSIVAFVFQVVSLSIILFINFDLIIAILASIAVSFYFYFTYLRVQILLMSIHRRMVTEFSIDKEFIAGSKPSLFFKKKISFRDKLMNIKIVNINKFKDRIQAEEILVFESNNKEFFIIVKEYFDDFDVIKNNLKIRI